MEKANKHAHSTHARTSHEIGNCSLPIYISTLQWSTYHLRFQSNEEMWMKWSWMQMSRRDERDEEKTEPARRSAGRKGSNQIETWMQNFCKFIEFYPYSQNEFVFIVQFLIVYCVGTAARLTCKHTHKRTNNPKYTCKFFRFVHPPLNKYANLKLTNK